MNKANIYSGDCLRSLTFIIPDFMLYKLNYTDFTIKACVWSWGPDKQQQQTDILK